VNVAVQVVPRQLLAVGSDVIVPVALSTLKSALTKFETPEPEEEQLLVPCE
jgi:hypothetical protein